MMHSISTWHHCFECRPKSTSDGVLALAELVVTAVIVFKPWDGAKDHGRIVNGVYSLVYFGAAAHVLYTMLRLIWALLKSEGII